MKRSLAFLMAIALSFSMLPIHVLAVSDNDLYTQYPYYLANKEYDKIETATSDICQEIVNSQKGFHEFEAIVATIVDDRKSIATGEIGAKLGLNSSYEQSIRENAIQKFLAAISAEGMSENEYNRRIASEAKKWMGVYKDITSPFKNEAELSSFLSEFLTSIGVDNKNVPDLQSVLIKKIPKLLTAGSQGITAYQTVLGLTAVFGYRLDSVHVLMDSVDKNSDLYKDLQHTLNQMMDPAKYFNENYTSKAVLGVVQKWIEKGTLDKVLDELKKGSETLNNASWALSLCKSLYFTFIYEGYKVDDYAEAVYLLSYETDIHTARTRLLSNFRNGVALTEDIDQYQKLFDLEVIAQIAALQAYAGLLSVYNNYGLKMKAEDQAALLSWNHDYNWYIKQCKKCLEADLAAGKAVKGTINNQAQPTNNTTVASKNVAANTLKQNGGSTSDAVSEAMTLVGKYPYVLGGRSPSDGGFDCSGLIYHVYHTRLGCNVTYEQIWSRSVPGTKITDKSSLLPGDIIFGLNNSGSWHTGLYCGNNTMIHAGSSKGVSKTSINGTWFTFKFATRPSFVNGGSSSSQTGAATDKRPTNFTVTTDKNSYAVGEPVVITPTASNATHYAISVWFGAFNTGERLYVDYHLPGGITFNPPKPGTYTIRADAKNSAGYISLEKTFTAAESASSPTQNTNSGETKLSVISRESGKWTIRLPRDVRIYDEVTATSESGRYGYDTIDCVEKAVLSDGSTRYCSELEFPDGIRLRWIVWENDMTIENPELSAESTIPSTPTTYIIFDSNGGIEEPQIKHYVPGGTYGSPAQVIVHRDGYEVEGWYSERVGGEKLTYVKVGENFEPGKTYTYYAHWVKRESYIVCLYHLYDEATGDPIIKEIKVLPGGTYEGLPASPVRPGYIFDGWYTSWDANGVWVTNGTPIVHNCNHNLWAHWTKIS